MIKAECVIEDDIDELLKTAVEVVPKNVITQEPEENLHKSGVVLGSTTLQLYNSTRVGFLPDDVQHIITDWKLSENIVDFYYEINQNG